MHKLIATCIFLMLGNLSKAQLLTLPHGMDSTGDVKTISDIPPSIANETKLKFILRDSVFDGGSVVGKYALSDGREFQLFFAHPGYWTAKAKASSKQPVAILGKKGKVFLSEIVQGSKLESHLCKLMAESIASGNLPHDAIIEMIELRDALLTRTPLPVFSKRFDPKTWDVRPSAFDNAFDNQGDTEAKRSSN